MKRSFRKAVGMKLAAGLASATLMLGVGGDSDKVEPRSPSSGATAPLYYGDKTLRSYTGYLQYTQAPVVNVPKDSYRDTDFPDYSTIEYDREQIPDNGVTPTLFVAERHDENMFEHIRHTSRTAYSVLQKLGGMDKVIAVLHPPLPDGGALSQILRNRQKDYLVVSHSQSTTLYKPAVEEYQETDNFDLRWLRDVDQNTFALYKSAGNERGKRCLTVDGVFFCMQSESILYHHQRNMVLVGAVEKSQNGTFKVKSYSNYHPTLCAPLPYRNGRLYKGTSFAAPSAAAVETRLADIFARSSRMPQGVAHEDIIMAMIVTAKTEALVDEKTNRVVAVFNNAAGIPMTRHCGAGVVRPQEAANLLNLMVQWNKDSTEITPTRSLKEGLVVKADAYHKKNGRYVYDLAFPHNSLVVSVRAGIPFEKGKKGAALLKIGDTDPVALDLAPDGMTTSYSFTGYEFHAGEKLQLITTKPIKGSAVLDFFTVNADSPIKKAIQYTQYKP